MSGTDNTGLSPYAFEPEYSDIELLERENHSEEPQDQLPSRVEEFCECSTCQLMPTADENICCHQSDLTVGNLDDVECITAHPNFAVIVLDPAILEVAFVQLLAFKRSRGRAPDSLTHTQSRLTAYRQFVCWMMRGERLGKGNRVVIPSCVVRRIRERYPDADQEYCGFKAVLDNLKDLF